MPAPNVALIKVGFGSLWVAPLGEDLPNLDDGTFVHGDDFGGNWVQLGCTEEGSVLNYSRDTTDIFCHEQITPADVVPNTANLNLQLILKEDTLENMKRAYGGGDITTTAAAVGQIGKDVLVLSDVLDKVALAVDVENPEGFFRVYDLPKVVSVGTVETAFRRAEARMYQVDYRFIGAFSDIDVINKTADALP